MGVDGVCVVVTGNQTLLGQSQVNPDPRGFGGKGGITRTIDGFIVDKERKESMRAELGTDTCVLRLYRHSCVKKLTTSHNKSLNQVIKRRWIGWISNT